MKFIELSTELLDHLTEYRDVECYNTTVLDKWKEFILNHPERLSKIEEILIKINQDAEAEVANYKSIINKQIRRLLNEMQVRLHNIRYELKVACCRLHNFITLLFGLCNSQSSFIFHSFWGSSLSRIPA